MWLPVVVVVLTVFNFICPQHDFFSGYSYREFGSREDGDVLSYEYNAYIPIFHRMFRVLVKPQRQDVEGNFTYLKVEYINKLTTVLVFYNATAQLVMFHMKYPFIRTPFNITGYSKLNATHVQNSSEACLNCMT